MGPTVSAPGHASESRNGSSAPRIVHILPYDQPRGAQRYARELVTQLEGRAGHNLIVTLFEGRPSGLRPDVDLGIRRGRLRAVGFDPRVVPRLSRALGDINPSIVVAHGGEAAKYAAFALRPGTPMIYLSIGSAHRRLARPVSAVLHRFYTKRAAMVVAVSKAVADEAVRRGVPGNKIVVIPNGRDALRYKPARRSGEETTRLIWIGQLDDTKRPEVFIDIVASLREDGVEVEAWMVGDGPRAPDLSSQADRSGVEVLGHRADVPSLLASSDLLIFTGTPPEGMPGVLIEAGMAGLATVSTRVPGADEVIDDGATGVLVDVDDIGMLTREVRRLVDDGRLRRAMGERARVRCVESFSFEATVGAWHALFDQVLGARAEPGR